MKKIIATLLGISVLCPLAPAQASEENFLQEVAYYGQYYQMNQIINQVENNPQEVLQIGYKICDLFRSGKNYQEIQSITFNSFKNDDEQTIFVSRIVNVAANNLCYYDTSGVASLSPWMSDISSNGSHSGGTIGSSIGGLNNVSNSRTVRNTNSGGGYVDPISDPTSGGRYIDPFNGCTTAKGCNSPSETANSGGNCENPWDRDSAGRLCGDRAATVR